MGSPITYVNGTRIYRWYFNKVDLNRAYMNKKLVFAKSLLIRVSNGFSHGSDKCGKYISIKKLIATYRKYNEQEITIEVVSKATVPRMIADQGISPSNVASIKLINNGYIRGSCQSGYGLYVYPNCNISLHNNGQISGGGGRGGAGGKGGSSGTKKWTTTSWSSHFSNPGGNGTTWQFNPTGGGGCCSNSILWWGGHRHDTCSSGFRSNGSESSHPACAKSTVYKGVKYKRGPWNKMTFNGCWNFPVLREDKKSHSIGGRSGGAGGAGGYGLYYGSADRRKGAAGGAGSRNSGGYRSGDGGQGGWGGSWGEPGKVGYTGKAGEHGSGGAKGAGGARAGYSIQGINRIHMLKTGTLHGPRVNT